MSSIVIDENFWVKFIFLWVIFLEALLAGLFPTWSKGCRESPKILGIANSFAGGVFLAIAFVHILPEESETYIAYQQENKPEKEKIFPLPYAMVFAGYTLILIIDKVMFDTHALFDEDHSHDKDITVEDVCDPAE